MILALGFIPKPNSAKLPTIAAFDGLRPERISSICFHIASAFSSPLTSVMIPSSTKIEIGFSNFSPSQEPSITILPFALPSFGRTNTFPAGKFVIAPGRLQIPLSSKIHRPPVVNFRSVPASLVTWTCLLLRSIEFRPEISFCKAL